MKKNSPRSSSKRPAATLDLKAKEISKDGPDAKTGKDGAASASADKSASSGSPAAAAKTASGKSASSAATGNKTSDKKNTASKAGGGQKPPTGGSRTSPSGTNGAGGGGFMSHLLASVVGAVLGIFGLSLASNQNMLPAPLQLSGGKALNEQISALTGKVGMLERTTSSSEPNGIGGRLANLNARLEKAEASLGGTTPGTDTLAQKVARLDSVISNLEQAARTGKGGKLAGLTAVTKQLTTANKQSLALKTEMIKVREEQTGFRQDLTSIRSAQADFTSTTAKISDDIARIRNSTAKIVADAARPPDVSAQINPVVAMLGDLTAKIDGVISREAGSKAEGRDIALALSLGELKRAVNEGAPFETELSRVLPHAPKDLDLSVLSQYAGKGIVTKAKLRSGFTAVSRKALSAEHATGSDSLVDQILSSAKNMVQVRPTGLVDGDNTGAVLSRMEYKLARNDLAGSLQESSALAGRAKDVMQPWLEQAGSKLGGDTVLRALEDKIRNALAGGVSK